MGIGKNSNYPPYPNSDIQTMPLKKLLLLLPEIFKGLPRRMIKNILPLKIKFKLKEIFKL